MTESNDKPTVKTSVAYATPKKRFWRYLEIPDGATVLDAIRESGVLAEFPAIDLQKNKLGIFGNIATADTVLKEGDRVEIYRPITVDPQLLQKRRYKLRLVEPIIETIGQTRKLEVADGRQSQHEEETVSIAGLFSEYGFVVKVDVTDIDRSLKWYRDKLGFQLDEQHSAGPWRQLTIPELPNTALGLYLNPDGAGLGGKKATFVVTDIELARDRLVRAGVEVDEIVELDEWVKLAFLRDPDGNIFGIRQNVGEQAAESA